MSKLPLVLVALTACTRWTSTPVYGPKQEVARRLLGSPQVEDVSSSNVSGGFATFGESYGNRHHSDSYRVGGIEGSHDSSHRTHCVQQAQVDYVQSVDYDTHAEHRVYDVAGPLVLSVAGLAIAGFAHANYNSDERFYEMDPSFFTKPSTPTVAYTVGGAAIAGAAAWLVYSFTSLPKGGRPNVESTQNAWTETTYVEASGCGLVPADR